MPVIDVILPVLDEAEAIPRVLGAIPAGYRPIVVDNGSSDGSADIARRFGAKVVHQPVRGFGAACFAGLNEATADVVCFMDCDASFDPRELPAVAEPVLAGNVELALGTRQTGAGELMAWPPHARIANKVLTTYLRFASGANLSDIGPMRAARRLDLLELELRDRRFGWPLEMILRANQAGWRILEVPVSYAPRIGTSKVTGTFRGTLHAVQDMARVQREVALVR
jgi:glycosyltransferase involved in cell wall biosynthesis